MHDDEVVVAFADDVGIVVVVVVLIVADERRRRRGRQRIGRRRRRWRCEQWRVSNVVVVVVGRVDRLGEEQMNAVEESARFLIEHIVAAAGVVAGRGRLALTLTSVQTRDSDVIRGQAIRLVLLLLLLLLLLKFVMCCLTEHILLMLMILLLADYNCSG